MDDTEKALDYYKTAALQTGRGPFPRPKYIPSRVALKTVVCSDGPMPKMYAYPGIEYPVHVNPLGAVSIEVDGDGNWLGLRLDEFDVVEWQENPSASLSE